MIQRSTLASWMAFVTVFLIIDVFLDAYLLPPYDFWGHAVTVVLFLLVWKLWAGDAIKEVADG